jgi:diguanylate cyclase (GGDEF)-like protein/PAS domain S-box-containing protein
MTEQVQPAPIADEQVLQAEIARLNKIIQALMNRAERNAGMQGSDFNLFQTAITLEEQVRLRTRELEAARLNTEKITRDLRKSENHYRLLVENAPVSIHELDLEGRITSMSRAGLLMRGVKEESEVLGSLYLDAVSDTDRERIAELLARSYAGETTYFEFKASGPHGKIFKSSFVPIKNKQGSVEKLMGITEDITEYKQAEEAITIANEFSRIVMDSIDDAISIIDVSDYRVIGCNAVFLKQVGLAEANVLGRKCHELTHNQLDPCGPPFDICPMKETVTAGKHSRVEHIHCPENDNKFYTEVSTSPVFDRNGKLVSVVHVSRDITERKKIEEQIRELAFYDTLTHLANRRLLNDRLGQAMAGSKRSGRYGAVMFLDLDNFKPLNDAHGHNVGDLLLIEVAQRLTRCVREMDTVARFGGDEFVVMLNELDVDQNLSLEQAGIVAEKIRLTLAEPYFLTSRGGDNTEIAVEHRCTSSIGVVLFINHEASPEDVIKWADMAMYQAKESGRNLVHFFEP